MSTNCEFLILSFLSFQNIISFGYGSGPHVLAVTKTGDLYTW